jgi:hypothetical protein
MSDDEGITQSRVIGAIRGKAAVSRLKFFSEIA